MRRSVVVAWIAALALPSAVSAAPAPISARTIDAAPVTLAFDPAGGALASWRGVRGAQPDNTTLFRALAARSPAGDWQPPRNLPRTVVSHAAALRGAGGFALVTTREQPAGRAHTRSLMTISLGRLFPFGFGATRVLDRGPRTHVGYDGPQPTLFSPLVAATPTGTVVAAWQRSVPRSRSGVWAQALGGKPRRLGPHGVSPSLRLAADGSGLLSWRRGSLLLARVRHSNGTWGPIERAGITARFAEVGPAVLAGDGRRWALASTEVTHSLSGVHFRPSLHVRVPGAGWRGAQLDEGTFTPNGQTAFVTAQLRTLTTLTPDGGLHVAWPAPRGGVVRVAVADVEADAAGVRVGPPLLLGENVALDDVAAGPQDRWAVTWFDLSRPDGTPNLVELGGAGPQVTTGLATERSVLGSIVAYDPLTGRPAVIWSQGSAAAGYQIVAG